jgi:hypothetical protein
MTQIHDHWSNTQPRYTKGAAMTEEQHPTSASEGKSAQTQLAAAVIAGYVLGRTKKGGAALALAPWSSGNQLARRQ